MASTFTVRTGDPFTVGATVQCQPPACKRPLLPRRVQQALLHARIGSRQLDHVIVLRDRQPLRLDRLGGFRLRPRRELLLVAGFAGVTCVPPVWATAAPDPSRRAAATRKVDERIADPPQSMPRAALSSFASSSGLSSAADTTSLYWLTEMPW